MVSRCWFFSTAVLAVVAFAIGIVHFDHPYPLMQIPDHGHALFKAPTEQHNNVVRIFEMSGLKPWGTFTFSGVRQTLFEDGITVVASGPNMRPGGAHSFRVKDPLLMAKAARAYMDLQGVRAELWNPQKELAVVMTSFGGDIAYTLPGQKMPWPIWEEGARLEGMIDTVLLLVVLILVLAMARCIELLWPQSPRK